MTDKEYKAQKARVWRLVNKWIPKLGLQPWKVTVNWEREKNLSDPRTIMDCFADWRYLGAVITAYLPTVAEEPDDHLEEIVIHELLHVHVNELRERKIDHEERVVTTLARVVMRLGGAN